jgi:hypothetical protein
MKRNHRGIESVKTCRKSCCCRICQFPSTQTPRYRKESGASQNPHDGRGQTQRVDRHTQSAKYKRLSPNIDRGEMSEEAVEPESAATETWCPKSLSLAECYCRIVDSDLVADDGGRWKFAIAIQHADGMQEQQNKAKIEKVLRRFYPPSLAWVHFVDTQLLLKCQSESFLIASNVPQGCAISPQDTAGISQPNRLIRGVTRDPTFRITTVISSSYFRLKCASWMKIARWNGGSHVL